MYGNYYNQGVETFLNYQKTYYFLTMNQLTKLILNSSLLFKPIHYVSAVKRILQRNRINKHNILTNKLCYYQSNATIKHGFKVNQKEIPFQQYIKQSINKFPYCKLPKYNQRFSSDKQLSPSQYQQLVAFNCLFVINQANKQKQLRQMGEILLKEDYQNMLGNKNNISGVEVFSLYYGRKLQQIISDINDNSKIGQQKVTLYYQVLTNLTVNEQVTKHIQQIKQQKILAMNAHIISLHIKLLIKHNLSYIHIIDKLYQHHLASQLSALSSQSNQHNLQAAKTLLSIQGFQEFFSENIKHQCLKIIIENVNNMDSFDHIMVIKHIYMNNSQDCINYINKVTQQIIFIHKLKKTQQLHVPLMLKVIKYRSKLHLDNKMFLDIINSYPEKFNTVFRQKNINKEIFLSLTTKQNSIQLNPQIRTQFGSYIRKVFDQYQQKSQIDEDQLIRNLKLVLKYGNEIKKQQLTQVMDIMVNNLYERIKHAASDQLKYYVFLVAFTSNHEELLAKTTIIHQTIETYHTKCLNQPTTDNITRAVNIQYQLMRKSPRPELEKNIWAYDYTKVELHPAVYSYLLFLLKKDKTPGSSKGKIQTIDQLKRNIFKNLSHGSYSMKIIYTLIDVLTQIDYKDKYMWVDIQRGICKNLQKYLTAIDKRKNAQLPLPKDIMFLKNKLARNKLCSTKFIQFLDQCENNYHMVHEYAKDYVQKSKNWQKMKDNFKRNRSDADKSSNAKPESKVF